MKYREGGGWGGEYGSWHGAGAREKIYSGTSGAEWPMLCTDSTKFKMGDCRDSEGKRDTAEAMYRQAWD